MIDKSKYPSNSMKEPKKVTQGSVVMRKKPLILRILGSTTLAAIGAYILWDVLVPAAKSTISEIVNNSTDMVLYGRERPDNIRRDRGRSYVSYNSMYDRPRRHDRTQQMRVSRHSFDDVVLETRGDAELVLSSLVEMIDQYGSASVASFYEFVGLESEWSDNKYGWTNLASAETKRTRDGYILVLPKPEVLD